MATRRPRPKTLLMHNTTPTPVVYDQAGRWVPGNTTVTVNPDDPVTTALIADRTLHPKEN